MNPHPESSTASLPAEWSPGRGDPLEDLKVRSPYEGVLLTGGTPERSLDLLNSRHGMLLNFRADMDVSVIEIRPGVRIVLEVLPGTEGSQPACRCYRCGQLLTLQTVQISKAQFGPGRPVCEPCNACDRREK